MVEIREVREEELDDYSNVGRQAFAHGERGENWLKTADRSTMRLLVAVDEDGIQARLCIHDYLVYMGSDAIYKMGAIGGVSCLPASRGKGYAGMLIKRMIEVMQEDGQSISTLFPFAQAFYRNYGWDWVGVSRKYTVPASIMTTTADTEDVRAAKAEDRTALIECYTEFSKRYRGMKVRTDKDWNNKFDDEPGHFTYTYLYENDGKVEGYLTFRKSKEELAEIDEFITLNTKAQAALIGLLHRHEMQIKKFRWHAPDNDTLPFVCNHNVVEASVEYVTQARVVDVKEALSQWKPNAGKSGSVVIQVADKYAPWNQGTWKVEFGGGGVNIAKTTDTAQVSLDIQALSQAFYGTPTVCDIRRADRLQVHDEAGYSAFAELLTGPPMYTADHF